MTIRPAGDSSCPHVTQTACVPSPTEVRRAGPADVDALADVLAESHADYVWERWALLGDDARARLAALYRADLTHLALPAGEVWQTTCGRSVAVWLPAGASTDAGDELERAAVEAFGERLAVLDEVEAVIAAARPAADWYLATMGTRPAAQRLGLGTAVLRPRLAELDHTGATAALETSTLDNVAFYSRLGFTTVAELATLPHAAPTTWVMFRPARAS